MAFPATRRSVVAAARSGDPEERARGLEALADAYGKPVYTYLRLRWRKSDEDARDLTQDLFARLVEKSWRDSFDPKKARLRTYLRLLVDGLASNDAKARGRKKRGGDVQRVSFDFDAVRAEVDARTAREAASPEEIFEREWARTVFTRAVSRLKEGATDEKGAQRFAIFARYDLTDESERPTYAELAAELDISPMDVTNDLAAARRDLRRHVLDVLRELAVSDEEYRLEARSLLGVDV